MKILDDLKKFVKEVMLPKVDLKDLGKDALEAVAFVLIERLEEVAKLIPGTFDDDLIQKLKVAADKIYDKKDRA